MYQEWIKSTVGAISVLLNEHCLNRFTQLTGLAYFIETIETRKDDLRISLRQLSQRITRSKLFDVQYAKACVDCHVTQVTAGDAQRDPGSRACVPDKVIVLQSIGSGRRQSASFA